MNDLLPPVLDPALSPYLTIDQACTFLNLKKGKLRQFLKAGLPHIGKGKLTRIMKEPSRIWLESRLKDKSDGLGLMGKKIGVTDPIMPSKPANPYTMKYNPKAGCFVAKVRKPSGGWATKWLPKTFAPHQEYQAQQHLIGWLASFYANEKTAPNVIPIKKVKSIRALADQWLALKQSDERISHNYFRALKRSLNCWLLDHKTLKHTSIEALDLETDFTVPVCKAWIASLKGSGSSKLAYILALRTFFNDAIIQSWIDPEMTNPLDKPALKDEVNKIRASVDKQRKDPNFIVSLDDAHAILLLTGGALPDVRRLRYLLAMATGLRDNELAALTWGDIKTAKNAIPYVEVNRQLLKIGSAPADDAKDPKSAKTIPPKRGSYRIVPLHPLAVAALDAWRSSYVGYTGHKPESHMPILGRDRAPHGAKKPLPGGSFTNVDNTVTLDRDCRDTGCPREIKGKHLVFHMLRHTFATMLAEQGADDSRVGRLLGHSKGSVARAHYISTSLTPDYEAVCKLPLDAVKFQAAIIKAPAPIKPALRLVNA